MNDLTNLKTVPTMTIDTDVFINSAIVAYKQKIKKDGKIIFKTTSDDVFHMVIPNHDGLFKVKSDCNVEGNCIVGKISKASTPTITRNSNYQIPENKVVVRYYHLWQELKDTHTFGINGIKGEYVDLPFSSPPKIVVT